MPKNKFGGNKAKKHKNRRMDESDSAEVPIASGLKFYGKVLRNMGESRLEILCNDGVTRVGLIPGSMRRVEWIYKNDIILIELRECNTDKKICDVIHKYSKTEVRYLGSLGYLKFIDKTDETIANEDIVFDL